MTQQPERPTGLNSFKMSATVLVLILGATSGGAAWQAHTSRTVAQVEKDVDAVVAKLAPLEGMPYRVLENEADIKKLDEKVDNLSNAIIGQMDLMRRDVNRLTTTVEVLNSRLGMLTGDIEAPRERRSRPAPR